MPAKKFNKLESVENLKYFDTKKQKYIKYKVYGRRLTYSWFNVHVSYSSISDYVTLNAYYNEHQPEGFMNWLLCQMEYPNIKTAFKDIRMIRDGRMLELKKVTGDGYN